MNSFEEIRNAYSDWEPAYPADWLKPTRQEIERIQLEFGFTYPQEFIEFQLVECHKTPMGDFAFDDFGWAEPSRGPMGNLAMIVQDAQQIGVPKHLAPFKDDNSDFFCFTETGEVVIWDHNSNMIETDKQFHWVSFIDWLAHTFDEE